MPSVVEIEYWKRKCGGCLLIADPYCSLNHGEFWCPIRLDGLSDEVLRLELAEGRIDAECFGWARERRAMSTGPRRPSLTSQLVRQTIDFPPRA